METNNNDLKKIKYICIIQITILFLLVYNFNENNIVYIYVFLILELLLILYFALFAYIAISKPYKDIRKVIGFIDNKQKGIFLDGDIGILYDRIVMLEKRSIAYEEVIKKEKDSLKKRLKIFVIS